MNLTVRILIGMAAGVVARLARSEPGFAADHWLRRSICRRSAGCRRLDLHPQPAADGGAAGAGVTDLRRGQPGQPRQYGSGGTENDWSVSADHGPGDHDRAVCGARCAPGESAGDADIVMPSSPLKSRLPSKTPWSTYFRRTRLRRWLKATCCRSSVFALLFGIALSRTGEAGARVAAMFR